MSIILAALLMAGGAPQGLDPAIPACTRVEQAYGREMYQFRKLLDTNTSDRGGRVDAGFITDINFALASAGDFVHTNIQAVQRAGDDGGQPSVRACKIITASAREQIEQYVGHLLSEVQPADRWSRDARLEEFRLGLQQSTRRLRGY